MLKHPDPKEHLRQRSWVVSDPEHGTAWGRDNVSVLLVDKDSAYTSEWSMLTCPKNCIVPSNKRVPGEDDQVHLAGVALLDFGTLCGYCWPDVSVYRSAGAERGGEFVHEFARVTLGLALAAALLAAPPSAKTWTPVMDEWAHLCSRASRPVGASYLPAIGAALDGGCAECDVSELTCTSDP